MPYLLAKAVNHIKNSFSLDALKVPVFTLLRLQSQVYGILVAQGACEGITKVMRFGKVPIQI